MLSLSCIPLHKFDCKHNSMYDYEYGEMQTTYAHLSSYVLKGAYLNVDLFRFDTHFIY